MVKETWIIIKENIIRLFIFLSILTFFSGISIAVEKPKMLYFYSKDCPECKKVKEEFLSKFLKKYGELFTFVELEVSKEANIDSLFALEDRFQIPDKDKSFPAVYFVGAMIEGEIKIIKQLESLVKTYVSNPDSMVKVHREIMTRPLKK